MEELQRRIGYTFRNPLLLQTALTHSSWTNEHGAHHDECYERMEFLGDSILGMVAAERLYRYEPQLPEGKMTRIRAELVCEESLFKVACELDLSRLMRLGRGEERTGGRERPSVLADMVEATIAAIFLDGGLPAARRFVDRFILRNATEVIASRSTDHKTELQELVQRKQRSTLEYRMTGEEGPDHSKLFHVAVYIDGAWAGEGSGRSKKEAEQAAAGAALGRIIP